MTASPAPANVAFLAGGGQTGALIAARDWSGTSLGPIGTWPQSLNTALSLILHSPVPMVMLWNEDGVMLYNDAYSAFAGSRHPELLGSKVREGWPEVADFNDNVMKVGLAGGALAYRDQELILHRDGRPEQAWMNLDYSPVFDESGRPAGVIAIVVETTDRVMAERAAAGEVQRLRDLYSQAPGFVAVLGGPEHVFEHTNTAYQTLIGGRDPVGKTIRQALPDVAGQGFFERLDHVYLTGEPYNGVSEPVVLEHRPGGAPEQRFLDFVYQPILDGTGAVSGIFVEGADVTERVHAQERLALSEETLRLATEAGSVGAWALDLVTGVLTWSGLTRAMFGISPDAPVSMDDFWTGLHPDDRDATRTAFEAALDPASRSLYDVEYRTIGKEDRVVRWVAAKGRGVFNAEGRPVRAIGAALDISDRKTIEAQLRARETELEDLNKTLEQRVAEALAERKILADLFDTANALVQVVDASGRLLAINKASAEAFEQMFGVRPRVGQRTSDLIEDLRPERAPLVAARWRRALAGEEFSQLEALRFPDGEERHYELHYYRLKDPAGAVVGAYQFAYDVTERQHDQDRLVEAEEQLRQIQKMEAIGQLTGGVAHDFNNLLMVITGGLDILDRQADPERRRRLMDGMRQAASRGSALTRQLLAFARRQNLTPQVLDLARQLGDMRELLDRSLGGDVRVEMAFAPDLWPVEADPGELELVVLNLAVNARDAMPGGGAIRVEADNRPGVQRGELQGDFVRLRVIDTGVGMSPEVVQRVFEPFFTTKEVGKGSGLGLPQVYGFARQSGGAAEIDSSPEQGTTVSLLLPRSTKAPPAAGAGDAGAPAAEGPGRPAGHVLLVEDDDEVAALVGDMLVQLSFEVTRASSADAALGALANGRQIDLVLSDVMMPGGMNGVELAREVRRRRPGLPVLLTSGYAEQVRREAEAERIALLPKPYNLQALAAAAGQALNPASPA